MTQLKKKRAYYKKQIKMLTQKMTTLKLNKKILKKKIQSFTNKKNVNFNNN